MEAGRQSGGPPPPPRDSACGGGTDGRPHPRLDPVVPHAERVEGEQCGAGHRRIGRDVDGRVRGGRLDPAHDRAVQQGVPRGEDASAQYHRIGLVQQIEPAGGDGRECHHLAGLLGHYLAGHRIASRRVMELLVVLARPFDERSEFTAYAEPPPDDQRNYRTYCGT